MSEMIFRAIDSCMRVIGLVGSMAPSEMPESIADEIQTRLRKVVGVLRGFEKAALLKTQKGRNAAQDIEAAAMNLEKALGSFWSDDPSPVTESLSALEQRVNDLQKTIEKLKRVVT